MAGGNQIVVVVGATVQDVVAQLGKGAAAVENFGASARRAGAGATAAFQGTTSSFSRFKEQLSRARESAMFFTSSLGTLGPTGRTVQMAIAGVAGAFLGGGGLLLALEAARVAMPLVGDAIKRMIEDANAGERAIKKVAETFDKFHASARSARLSEAQRTFEEAVGSEEYKKLEQKVSEGLDQLYAARKKAQDLEEKYQAQQERIRSGQWVNDPMAYGGVQLAWDEVAAIKAKTGALIDQKAAIERNANAQLQAALHPAPGSDVGFGQTWGASVTGPGAGSASPQSAPGARPPSFGDDAARRAWGLAQYGGYGAGAPSGETIGRARGRWEYGSSQLGVGAAGEAALAAMTGRSRTAEQDEENKRLNKTLDEQHERQKILKDGWKDILHEGVSAARGIITGQLSIKQAGTTVMNSMIDLAQRWGEKRLEQTLTTALFDRVTTSTTNVAAITSEAPVAAANAFAATAAIPVVGPELAPEAAAAAMSAVMAMAPMAAISAAEEGWRLPDYGGPFPSLLHRGERVLNQRQNRDYEDTQAVLRRQGGGGPSYDLRGAHFYGRSSFEEIARVSGRGVARGMRTLKRRGAGG